MATLKVKPLEWYMEDKTHAELLEDGYSEVSKDFPLVGRDGYYHCAKWGDGVNHCWLNATWFEFNGRGYYAYPTSTRERAREYFCYNLTVNDEAILPEREVRAMRDVLKVSRDSAVKRVLRARVRLHEEALDLRNTGTRARLVRIRILGW